MPARFAAHHRIAVSRKWQTSARATRGKGPAVTPRFKAMAGGPCWRPGVSPLTGRLLRRCAGDMAAPSEQALDGSAKPLVQLQYPFRVTLELRT